jgi:hypothetical protein
VEGWEDTPQRSEASSGTVFNIALPAATWIKASYQQLSDHAWCVETQVEARILPGERAPLAHRSSPARLLEVPVSVILKSPLV